MANTLEYKKKNPSGMMMLKKKNILLRKANCTRMLLDDLRYLARRFRLTIAGYDEGTGAWASLSDLRLRADTRPEALRETCLRVYTADDYLTRWRADLAKRLRFTAIPAGDPASYST